MAFVLGFLSILHQILKLLFLSFCCSRSRLVPTFPAHRVGCFMVWISLRVPVVNLLWAKLCRERSLEESVGPGDHTALPGETLCSTERGGEKKFRQWAQEYWLEDASAGKGGFWAGFAVSEL